MQMPERHLASSLHGRGRDGVLANARGGGRARQRLGSLSSLQMGASTGGSIKRSLSEGHSSLKRSLGQATDAARGAEPSRELDGEHASRKASRAPTHTTRGAHLLHCTAWPWCRAQP